MSTSKLASALASIQFLFRRYPSLTALISFLAVFIFFSALSPKFYSYANLRPVLAWTAELGIVTVGVSFLMISGEFDLSVGSTTALAAVIYTNLQGVHGLGLLEGSIITLIAGAGIGLLNGLVTVKSELPSFIVTLGSMMFFRGMVFFLTGGFTWPIVISNQTDRMVLDFLLGSIVWYYPLAAIFGVTLNYTFYGNHTMAVGRSKETARYMGVNYQKVKVTNFVLCGLLAALGGCVTAGRFRISSPTTGQGLELETIAAAVIGGNVLTGGYGSIVGSIFGSLIVSMVRSGLILAGAPAYWYVAFVGLILLAAALIQTIIRGRRVR